MTERKKKQHSFVKNETVYENSESSDECYTKEGLKGFGEKLNLSSHELDIIFSAIDSDDDGIIKKSDILNGNSSSKNSTPRQRTPRKKDVENGNSRNSTSRKKTPRINDVDSKASDIISDPVSGITDVLSDERQEQVIDLYQQLHSSDNPELLDHFESIILGVIKDLKTYKSENERLEKTFKREKTEHEKHLRQLEDEMELQMQKVEERVREQEQARVEAAKASLKKEVEKEISSLQQNLTRLQQEGLGSQSEELEHQLLGLKNKLEEINVENRQLKSELTDATTNLAVFKSELVTVKQQYSEKCRELHSQRATVMDCIKEQDKLTRQLHLLHNANRQLHDTNDDLREVIEKQSPNSTPAPSIVGTVLEDIYRERRGSIMSDYVHSGPASVRSLNFGPSLSLVEDLDTAICTTTPSPRMLTAKLPVDETCEEDNYDIDSGHSTLRDQNDIDTENEAPVFDLDNGRGRRRRRRYKGNFIPETDTPTIITKAPERIYKVVLAGDAAVGKSSFIMRLCKGKFVSNISSTLGVDFQTKLLEVDNKTIALQLWDTAGQERFRSIAKSYFRRADGVLLLYDCTYERSFLNIREWVDSIEESSHKRIPIMFVANKTDLREESQKQGRRIVKYEDGQRLAREYAGLFIETSAKDGSNITEAVTELSRLLSANEDLEVKTVGLQLHDGSGSEKKSGCCGK